uniref:Uncharacterized protein n=1 Tax=Anguilla anguilla TaxID=7936 RepID=A0A0E9S5D1_ANGAN
MLIGTLHSYGPGQSFLGCFYSCYKDLLILKQC